MRVLVTGSRRWESKKLIYERLIFYPVGTVVVHGNCRGADLLAHEVALELGQVPEPHPARWDLYPEDATTRRNQEMVDLGADVCEAFPHHDSKGTFDCIKRCKRAGIPVEETWEED